MFDNLFVTDQETATVDISINTDGYITSFIVYYTIDTQYHSLIQTQTEMLSFQNIGESVEVVPIDGYEDFEEIYFE